MAVFTDLSDKDCELIANAYQLGALTSVIGIADGDTETTFLFRSARGEFIITLFETGAEHLDLERAFRTMEVLSAAGIPCPTTFRTQAGAATITVSGKMAAAVSFVSGSLTQSVTNEKCHKLGEVAARIHVTLSRAGKTTKASLPRGPIHGALNRENVFFLGDDISGVINFRLRHDDILISELAHLITQWAMREDGLLYMGLSQRIIAGYENIRCLTIRERQALPAFLMAASVTSIAENSGVTDIETRAYATLLCSQELVSQWWGR